MSIYQVPIKSWFCDHESPFNEQLCVVEIAIERGATCEKCGEPITMERGYCSHAIAYGFSEMYCCAKCAGYKEDEFSKEIDDLCATEEFLAYDPSDETKEI